MKILPVNPTENVTPESLRAFLLQCVGLAAAAGRPQLVSISLLVEDLDPLAVLESIFEPAQLHDEFVVRPRRSGRIVAAELGRARCRHRDESRQGPHLAA